MNPCFMENNFITVVTNQILVWKCEQQMISVTYDSELNTWEPIHFTTYYLWICFMDLTYFDSECLNLLLDAVPSSFLKGLRGGEIRFFFNEKAYQKHSEKWFNKYSNYLCYKFMYNYKLHTYHLSLAQQLNELNLQIPTKVESNQRAK